MKVGFVLRFSGFGAKGVELGRFKVLYFAYRDSPLRIIDESNIRFKIFKLVIVSRNLEFEL